MKKGVHDPEQNGGPGAEEDPLFRWSRGKRPDRHGDYHRVVSGKDQVDNYYAQEPDRKLQVKSIVPNTPRSKRRS